MPTFLILVLDFFSLSISFFEINSKSLFQFFKRVDFYKHVSNHHTVHLKGIYTMLNVNEISRKQRKDSTPDIILNMKT